MKDIKYLEDELPKLLMKYMDKKVLKNDDIGDDLPVDHLFLTALEKCEELINYVNNFNKEE